MKFALRNPCKDCPFRSDREYPFFGRDQRGEARARELAASFTDNHLFPCHKTADWVEDGEREEVVQQRTEKTSACAGMVIMAEQDDRHSNILRIAGRLGFYDPTVMNMDAPVYRGYDAFIEDHTPSEHRSGEDRAMGSARSQVALTRIDDMSPLVSERAEGVPGRTRNGDH